jgi:hypothetical protein
LSIWCYLVYIIYSNMTSLSLFWKKQNYLSEWQSL